MQLWTRGRLIEHFAVYHRPWKLADEIEVRRVQPNSRSRWIASLRIRQLPNFVQHPAQCRIGQLRFRLDIAAADVRVDAGKPNLYEILPGNGSPHRLS